MFKLERFTLKAVLGLRPTGLKKSKNENGTGNDPLSWVG